MLAAECGVLDRCFIVGTDCRPQAIAQARDAIYSAADLPARWSSLLHTHGHRIGDGARLQISRQVRSAVQWRLADVMKRMEAGPWDLICCRNLLMYLREEAARGLWDSLAEHLRVGGILVTGKAERPPTIHRLTAIAPCVYRRDRGQ
jgi:chemotaxis protein methyltransferase CheR